MLGLLVTVCAIVAVVVVIHLGGNSDTEEAQSRVRDRRRAESEEPELAEFTHIEEAEMDFRFWQRAATKQKETGYWQYYPIIPWNILPGETVVLSVSAEGFKGWEADVKYAQVEFFDMTSDGENASVSFIMPNEHISIAALYENEIPQINHDNQRNAVMSMMDMHEYGAAPITASDETTPPPPLRPEPDVIVDMPPAIVDLPYNVRLSPPVGVVDNGNLDWKFSFPSQLDWLTWTYTPAAVDGEGNRIGGGRLHNKTGVFPTTQGGPYLFSVEIWDTSTEPASIIDMYNFRISVRRPGSLPEVFTTDIPDGMVGVDYFVLINTGFFPQGSTWDWSTGGGEGLPDSIELWVDQLDNSRGGFRGRPTLDDIENGPDYSFNLYIDRTMETTIAHPEIGDLDPVPYRIKIWDKPVITTPLVPLPPIGPTPPNLLDGIANNPNVEKRYSIALNATGPISSDATTVPGWTWRVTAGSLPPGLGLPAPPASPPAAGNSAEIGGYPTTPGEYTFTVRFMANQNLLQGWIEETYTIRILQPPRFTTDSLLAYGMEGPPDTTEPSEDPNWYNSPIDIVEFPTGTKWTWSISAGTIPSGLSVGPELSSTGVIIEVPVDPSTYRCPLELSGVPGPTSYGTNGIYKFTIEVKCIDPNNYNIDGVTVSKEFEVRIWPRTYLNISMLGVGNRGYVRRDNYNPTPSPGELTGDPNWAQLNAWTAADAMLYEGKRAIMPGERGIISTNSGGGFVRWEISPNYNSAGANLDPLTYSAASRLVQIGGPDSINPNTGVRTGYGTFPAPPAAGQHGYVIINMPMVPFPATRSEHSGDVFLRAEAVGVGRPVITQSPLRQGMEGALYEAAITIDRNDMGSGPHPMRWQIMSPGTGTLPPGLRIDEFATNRGLIEGIPTLSQVDPFNFTVSITLPGTMRIDRPFSIIINPWDGLGDVNDDGVVDLRDLVLLVRYQDDKSININMRNARLSTNGEGSHDPGPPDVRILTRYFTSSQSSLNP